VPIKPSLQSDKLFRNVYQRTFWANQTITKKKNSSSSQGVEALVTSLNTSASKGFANDNFTDWVVDGEVAGACKSAGVLSYLRVFEAVEFTSD
jgi:hypothetical protein